MLEIYIYSYTKCLNIEENTPLNISLKQEGRHDVHGDKSRFTVMGQLGVKGRR